MIICIIIVGYFQGKASSEEISSQLKLSHEDYRKY